MFNPWYRTRKRLYVETDCRRIASRENPSSTLPYLLVRPPVVFEQRRPRTEFNRHLYFSFPYNLIRFSCRALSRPDKTRMSRYALLVLEGGLSLLGKGGHALLLIGRGEQLLEETSFETESFAQGELVGCRVEQH
jgi:hypothetical protein